MQAGRATQGAKPVNVFYFGSQRVRTRNYVVMREEDNALDLMALAAEASLGRDSETPQATLGSESVGWEEADAAGIPQRVAPPQPWAPRTAPEPPVTPTTPTTPATPTTPEKVPTAP